MLETLKILISFIGGGFAGSLITEWFRRRREKVQSVDLIERVNRQVSPRLEGVTLARWVRGADHPDDLLPPRLEELTNLREYQLTMRNSTSVHLENAEIQFEFPADEVSADVQRPARSKTPLEPMVAKATAPYKTAYRWRIPQLPSGDSVEFTFRAVNSLSKEYEAALYHKGIVLDRIVGEPSATKKREWQSVIALQVSALAIVIGMTLFSVFPLLGHEKLSNIKVAGCELQIVSHATSNWFRGPWTINNRILNIGSQDCVFQSKALNIETNVVVHAGETIEREKLSNDSPKLNDASVSVGPLNSSLTTATASVYVDSN